MLHHETSETSLHKSCSYWGFFKYCLCYSPCIKECISRKPISIKTCIFFLPYMNCIQFAQLISFLKCGLLDQLNTSNFSLILPKETTTITLLTGIRTVSYPLNVKCIPLKVTVYCLIVFFLENFAEEAQKKQQQQQKLSTSSPNNADRKKKIQG